ncbi:MULTISPECIES: ABC transporter permease subunit [unclassified Streptomyces]|jgi:ABC-type transport system involved in multi-copper enzyme maturation permease subunit|uniref:ABC transporter permease subunit n=1 Tax=unclassified Streptomyces TaxID=2593676 RepID=UPI0036918FEF
MTAPLPSPAPHSYVSPIPVRRAHLGDALASEWTKIRSLRSTMWTLGVMVLLMLGVGFGVALIVAASDYPAENEAALGLGFFGLLLGSICVMTLGVLTIASEYGTGMIRTTLTACPSRGRVLLAKAIVFFALVFTITTLTATVVAVAQVALVSGPDPTVDQWLRATVGAGLFLALTGLVSLAVGTLIRHSAGAITIMIGVLLMPLVAAMFMMAESLSGVRDWLLAYALPSQMIALYSSVPVEGASGPTGWDPVWIMLVLALGALGGAFAVLNSRDV